MMKVSTPSISWHNRERISSCDFQPSTGDGIARLATVGDDKMVVIWRVVKMADKPEFGCLADLNRHQNSVNVVRWSRNGKFLASGDTDSFIYLWTLDSTSAPVPDLFNDDVTSGENDNELPRENWVQYKILRGHLQDVVSLSWSSDGSLLLSSSTDNTAILFDINKGTKLKIFSDHKGWVNGVAFDPLSQYLATLCSDRILRVYHTKGPVFKNAVKTYKCSLPLGDDKEEKLVRLFHDDTFPSFYRRLEFSPDGNLLVVPSGVLDVESEANCAHCTYVFTRQNLNKPVLYLPNKEYSVAVRFNPNLYELRSKSTEDEPALFDLSYRMIYAVATQNTVMFYDTQQSIPFARVSKIHYIGLTDLSWSPDGLTCIVSSTDGFCSVIEFKKSELGKIYKSKTNTPVIEPEPEKPRKETSELISDSPKTKSPKSIKDKMEVDDDDDLNLVLEPDTCLEATEKPKSPAANKGRRVSLITLSKE